MCSSRPVSLSSNLVWIVSSCGFSSLFREPGYIRVSTAQAGCLSLTGGLRGYPPDTLLYQPQGLTADELLSGYARLTRQTYSFDSMFKQFFGMSPWERTLRGCLAYGIINLSCRFRYLKGLAKPQPYIEAAT
jgi:hypothetical protein